MKDLRIQGDERSCRVSLSTLAFITVLAGVGVYMIPSIAERIETKAISAEWSGRITEEKSVQRHLYHKRQIQDQLRTGPSEDSGGPSL